jgi:hypothetical protein
MPNIILLSEDEDSAEMLSVTRVRKTSISHLFAKIQTRRVHVPLLPYGTVAYQKTNSEEIFAVMTPPKFIEVVYGSRSWRIAVPWRVFRMSFTGGFCQSTTLRFMKKFASDLSDPLYYAPLPNVERSGKVCMPDNLGSATKSYPLAERPLVVIHQFDTSKYNSDILQSLSYNPFGREYAPDAGPRGVGEIMDKWEEESNLIHDPHQCCQWSWLQTSLKFGELI